jgi:hypothetical protein
MRDHLIVEALKNVLDCEADERALVRDEIKQRGTYWAGEEIWKLRRQVRSLRKQLSDREANQ